MSYDSTEDTKKHIQQVRDFLSKFSWELARRGDVHDQSKLESPEKEEFDRVTERLKTLPYGSDEYKESLKDLKPALDHHYANNTHHPEHYHNGINGMDLYDLVEMFCDWQAAVLRTKGGDLNKSIEINKDRFKMSDQLVDIFRNTVSRLK